MRRNILISSSIILCASWLRHDCYAQENSIRLFPPIIQRETYNDVLLPQDRLAELERLSSLLLDGKWDSKSAERREIVQSLKRSGYINANALAPLIVNFLDFHVSELGYAGLRVDAIPSNDEVYPAIYGLEKLGRAALDPIINSLAVNNHSPVFQDNAVYTLRNITDQRNNSTVRSILKSSSEEFTRRGKRLRLLAKAIEGQSPENITANLNALFPEPTGMSNETAQISSDDVLTAAKEGNFTGVVRLFGIYAEHTQNVSAAFLSQYLDLYNPQDRTYPAMDALITFGPQGISEVARQISASGKRKIFVLNGIQVLQQVSDNKGVVQILNSSATEFDEQAKLLLSLAAKLR